MATKTVKEDNSQRVPLKGGRLSIHLFGAQSIFVQGRSNLGLEKEKRKKKRRRRRRGGQSQVGQVFFESFLFRHTTHTPEARIALAYLLTYLREGVREGAQRRSEEGPSIQSSGRKG